MSRPSTVMPASSEPPAADSGPETAVALTHPSPRYPEVPDVTELEQLLPYARHIAQRPMPYTGDQRPGYGIKGGEKILFVTDSDVDPLVVEAFTRVLRDENKCQVDIFEQQGNRRLYRTEQVMKVLVDSEPALWMLGGPEWTQQVAKKKGYDKVIGQIFWEENNLRLRCHNFSMDWPTREQLASPAVLYPEEIIEALDRAAWQTLLQAESSTITDPQGTDITFTWLPEYWQIMDGNYPDYPTDGFGTHHYYHGALKDPLISSHLCGYPLGIVLPKSDVSGVMAGTADHLGPYAHIKIYLEHNKVTRMEGGGEFGEKWRDFIDRNKRVRFPHYPGPGVDWFVEAAIGTHPKISRPFNVLDSATARSTFMAERDRSGIMHLGIGQILDFAWALRQNPPLPFYHFHVHLDFCTYTCKFKNGREVRLVDKGHLTVLDDPGVRAVAAKYGDPDELLREDWIPAIPGINVAGDYWKDYAPDPETYIQQEHRKAYGAAIERSKRYYK
ncbi:MAG: hypothetical protein WB729_11685 [Candidatus Sulfotelmatobacter sp.]